MERFSVFEEFHFSEMFEMQYRYLALKFLLVVLVFFRLEQQ